MTSCQASLHQVSPIRVPSFLLLLAGLVVSFLTLALGAGGHGVGPLSVSSQSVDALVPVTPDPRPRVVSGGPGTTGPPGTGSFHHPGARDRRDHVPAPKLVSRPAAYPNLAIEGLPAIATAQAVPAAPYLVAATLSGDRVDIVVVEPERSVAISVSPNDGEEDGGGAPDDIKPPADGGYVFESESPIRIESQVGSSEVLVVNAGGTVTERDVHGSGAKGVEIQVVP